MAVTAVQISTCAVIQLIIIAFSTLVKTAIAAASSPSSGSRSCDSEWVPYGTSCYKGFSDSVTWPQAKQACEAFNAHLVTLTTAQENTFVHESLAKGKTLWIGLQRNPTDFEWVTGEPLSFNNWISGSPDNPIEKCGEMTDYSLFHGMWNDNDCAVPNAGYICEKGQKLQGVYRIIKNKSLYGHVIKELTTAGDVECVLRCLHTADCKSVNYDFISTPGICQISSSTVKEYPNDFIEEENVSYYDEVQ